MGKVRGRKGETVRVIESESGAKARARSTGGTKVGREGESEKVPGVVLLLLGDARNLNESALKQVRSQSA